MTHFGCETSSDPCVVDAADLGSTICLIEKTWQCFLLLQSTNVRGDLCTLQEDLMLLGMPQCVQFNAPFIPSGLSILPDRVVLQFPFDLAQGLEQSVDFLFHWAGVLPSGVDLGCIEALKRIQHRARWRQWIVASALVAKDLIRHVVILLLLSEQLVQLVRIGPVFVGQVHWVYRALVRDLLGEAYRHVIDVVAALGVQLGDDVVVIRLLLHYGQVLLPEVRCHGVLLVGLWLSVKRAVVDVAVAGLWKRVVLVLIHVVVLCYLGLTGRDLVFWVVVHERLVVIVGVGRRLLQMVLCGGSHVIGNGFRVIDVHVLRLYALVDRYHCVEWVAERGGLGYGLIGGRCRSHTDDRQV